MKSLSSVLITIAIMLMATSYCWAGDLDDGIDFDKPETDSLQKEVNLKYVILKAKAKAKAGSNQAGGGAAGIGNISFGAGSNLKGAIIINNSNNKGAAAVAQ